MKKSFLIITFILIIFSGFSQDKYTCDMIKKTLKSIDVYVTDIKIADGRKNGGVRSMIVTYTANLLPKNQAGEITKVLECLKVANEKLNADLDEISAVIGDMDGKALAVINVSKAIVNNYYRTKNTEEYVKSWNVYRVNKNFLPSLLSHSKQI
ncbi:MAG: hypothetical protein HQ541_16915 [Mariniphaga sp.]|nr:hypothetical protein [Mariniphaga sp.]